MSASQSFELPFDASMSRRESAVLHITEGGLIVAVIVAVLMFGGVEPPFFLLTQLTILACAILVVAANLHPGHLSGRLPVAFPATLICGVALQLVPLPRMLLHVMGARPDVLPDEAALTLSIDRYQTVNHLLLLIAYIIAFLLTFLVCRNRNANRHLVYGLIAVGLFEACYGLMQHFAGWQQIFAYKKKYYLEDGTGTYINRNHFAGFLEMVLPFAVAFALHIVLSVRRNSSPNGRQWRALLSTRKLPGLLFWIVIAFFLFGAIVTSRSRMGMISSLASLVTIVALAGATSLSAKTRVVAAGLFLLSVGGLVVWLGSDSVLTRFETLGQEYSQTEQNRVSIWRDTLGLLEQHPLVGTGLGTFAIAYPSVQTAFLDLQVDHAHSDYLEVASELGIPAGILLFGSFFWVLTRSIGHYRTADGQYDSAICLGCIGGMVAILVHSLADFNLYIPANALVFSMILALACSAAGVQRGRASARALSLEDLRLGKCAY